jgi:tetratricopeptide (TPR) repeat protein
MTASLDESVVPVQFTAQAETPVLDQQSIQPELVISPGTAQLASNHINYGKTLARKGATFSARNEFVNALLVVSQSFDMQAGCKEYTEALACGMRVLDEADDFFASNGLSNIQTDVSAIVDTHLSRLLTKEQAAEMTRAEAMQTYYSYARSQLRRACGIGQNWVASEAFYSLGRLHGLSGQTNLANQSKDYAKSIVLHFAAMDACTQNFASANELGVLLATSGQLKEARELLIRSVTLNPQAESWQNLATVHERMGESSLALLARNEAGLIRGSVEQAAASRLIRWVDSQEIESIPEFGTDYPAQSIAQQPDEVQPTQGNNSPPTRQSSNWVEKVKRIF